jgi:hypothetical protein
MSVLRSHRAGFATVVAIGLIVLAAGAAQAHIVKNFGPYTIALGWAHEPAYVGGQNAVQVVITDAAGKAMTDLPDGDLRVVVSLGSELVLRTRRPSGA